MRPSRRRSLFHRAQQFFARNGRRAALHHYNSARVIGQLCRFFRAGPGSQRRAKCRNHRIARTGYVGNLIRTENRNIHRRMFLIECHHAVVARA